MKKIILISVMALIFVFGASNLVMAHWAGTNPEPNGKSFETMLPQMQTMHPEMSEDELRQMYENCPRHNGDSPGYHQQMRHDHQILYHGNMMR